MQQIQWQDRFNIGVEIVDQAHRHLFAIVQKIMELYVERHENRFACVEGIKYFKAYALKHFAEEEAYMKEIGYPGYLAHKRIHDRMRWETLPALERALYASDFSTEAVQRFIGICTGWLTGHIMIEDRAITGRSAVEPAPADPSDESALIRAVILAPLGEMFGCTIQYVGGFSSEESIADAQYYELICAARDGERLRFVLIIGEPLLLRAAGQMFGMDFYSRDEIVRFAIQEIAQNLIQRAEAAFGMDSSVYQLERDRFLEGGEYREMFRERPPRYSLLFHVNRECFALCIDRLAEPVSPRDPGPSFFPSQTEGEAAAPA